MKRVHYLEPGGSIMCGTAVAKPSQFTSDQEDVTCGACRRRLAEIRGQKRIDRILGREESKDEE